ncbi:MAG: hypothetical protein K0S28_1074 [Paucimonas sp.]|jgi:hypothetical protein|nr:hypothetical protein [Paucimonas sp.]
MNKPNDTNPMNPPEEPGTGTDDGPKFGRLLVVLLLAVMAVVAITFASEAYYSR